MSSLGFLVMNEVFWEIKVLEFFKKSVRSAVCLFNTSSIRVMSAAASAGENCLGW